MLVAYVSNRQNKETATYIKLLRDNLYYNTPFSVS